MSSHHRLAISFVSAVALAMLPEAVAGQTLEIAPVTIDLPAGQLTSIIRITNRGDQSTTIQMRPFDWSQKDGKDSLGHTDGLMVSPPFTTLRPGDTQTIRIVLRKPASSQESAYRLLIDQLPPDANPGSVHVALRISLPVFAAPPNPVQAALTWRVVGSDPVKRTLVVQNTGTRRAKISDLKIGGSVSTPGFTFQYVLAGSQAAIPVEAGPDGWALPSGSVHISGSSNQGKVEADAPFAPA